MRWPRKNRPLPAVEVPPRVRCRDCNAGFTRLPRGEDRKPRCPECGSNLLRLV